MHIYCTTNSEISRQQRHLRLEGVVINTQLSANDFINILYFNADFKPFNRNFTILYLQTVFMFWVISFMEHLPEDGHNKWPKHVGDYAVYNTINLHICLCTSWCCFLYRHCVAWPGKYLNVTMCFGPINALVCNKTLNQMSHIKTLKITPTCFDHQRAFDPS
jgi:hypothetical protein